MLMDTALRKIKSKAKDYIYSYEEKPIEHETGKLLLKKKLTISVAESCTGGLVCSKLTNIPGSSDYITGGVVAYSNSSKIKMLGVRRDTLSKFGAVSKQTAMEMAEGIRKRALTDIGLSVTGIAGPSGATKTKPIGFVWIGYSDKSRCYAKEFIFTKDRLRNKEIMSKMALEIVRKELLNK
jgi:nicotinamide-nucleotide amidase